MVANAIRSWPVVAHRIDLEAVGEKDPRAGVSTKYGA
jgi:hypothetical protein